MKVKVLYEDQLAGNCEIRDYAPHRLLLNCLFDRADIRACFVDLYELGKQVAPMPCKGDANVTRQLKKHIDSFNNARIAPVVCLDSDKANRQFNLPAKSCKIVLRQAFWEIVAKPSSNAFVLLDQNLEDVLLISQRYGANFPEDQLTNAITHKNHLERDILFRKAAKLVEVRKALTSGAMPSFQYLVEKTAGLVLL